MYKKILILSSLILLISCSKKVIENKNYVEENIIPKVEKEVIKEYINDKVPDKNAPVLEDIFSYVIEKKNKKIVKIPDGVDKIDESNLIKNLIENGVLPEACNILSFYVDENNNADLNLSNFDIDNKLIVVCIQNTLIENLELNSLSISLNGTYKEYTKNLSYEKNYKNLK